MLEKVIEKYKEKDPSKGEMIQSLDLIAYTHLYTSCYRISSYRQRTYTQAKSIQTGSVQQVSNSDTIPSQRASIPRARSFSKFCSTLKPNNSVHNSISLVSVY